MKVQNMSTIDGEKVTLKLLKKSIRGFKVM